MADRSTWLHSCQHCGWVQQGNHSAAGSPHTCSLQPTKCSNRARAHVAAAVCIALGAGAERAGHLLEDVLLLVASNLVTIFSLGSPERGGKQ